MPEKVLFRGSLRGSYWGETQQGRGIGIYRESKKLPPKDPLEKSQERGFLCSSILSIVL